MTPLFDPLEPDDADLSTFVKVPGLRAAREKAGWTRKQVSQASSFRPLTVKDWETGRRRVRLGIAQLIAVNMGCNVVDLLYGARDDA